MFSKLPMFYLNLVKFSSSQLGVNVIDNGYIDCSADC